MKPDRFTLEEDIMVCWNVVEDIDFITKHMPAMSRDELFNTLVGIKHLYQIKFQKLFSTFENMLDQGNIG